MDDEVWNNLKKLSEMNDIFDNKAFRAFDNLSREMDRMAPWMAQIEKTTMPLRLQFEQTQRNLSLGLDNTSINSYGDINKGLDFISKLSLGSSDPFGRFDSFMLGSRFDRLSRDRSIDPYFLQTVDQITRLRDALPLTVNRLTQDNIIFSNGISELHRSALESGDLMDFEGGQTTLGDQDDLAKRIDDLFQLISHYIVKVRLISSNAELRYISDLALSIAVAIMITSWYHQDALREASLSEERLNAIIDDSRIDSNSNFEKLIELNHNLRRGIEDMVQKYEFNSAIFYIVKERPVKLFVDNEDVGKSYTTLLHSGQMVELIERDKKWIRVIAYDAATDTTHVGWVMKKYLKML